MTSDKMMQENGNAGLLDGRARLRLISILFFFSGFAALIYQIIWQRALFRILGVNIEAITIVVTAFMVGLGIGSLMGGVLSRRFGSRCVLLLAIIEALTACFGLFSLSIFEAVGRQAIGAQLPVLAFITFCLVAVPTLLMGATLPVLVSHLTRMSGLPGEAVGSLYYVNTIGAAFACMFGSIAIFPFTGMAASIWIAAVLNLVIAACALYLHRQSSNETAIQPLKAQTSSTSLPFPTVLGLAALSGFISLSCEIFFMRLTSLITGGLAASFSLTLGVFLMGVAAGSRSAAELEQKASDFQRQFILRDMCIALLVLAGCLPLLRHAGLVATIQLAIIGACAYVTAKALGLLLPYLAGRGIAADERTGSRVSFLYMANIAGSASGSLLTGFVLMDVISTELIALTLICLFALIIICFAFTTRAVLPTKLRLLLAASLCIGAAILPLTQGLFERLIFKEEMATMPAVATRVENRSGIITIFKDGRIFGGGIYDGAFNTDLVNDVNFVVRPFALSLFHANPKRVLMIGLSSGSWARIVANHPQVEELTIVEINPGYAEILKQQPEGEALLRHPKIRIITDDGRRWLGAYQQRFDAIIQNTTFHFRANITNLLSRDYLELIKMHLNDGGIFFYNTTGSRRVQRTACMTLPGGLLFINHMAVSNGPVVVDFDRWKQTLINYRIDGKSVLDLTREADQRKLDRLMGLKAQWDNPAQEEADIMPCSEILRHSHGLALITDDNMGTEWRYPLGLQ